MVPIRISIRRQRGASVHSQRHRHRHRVRRHAALTGSGLHSFAHGSGAPPNGSSRRRRADMRSRRRGPPDRAEGWRAWRRAARTQASSAQRPARRVPPASLHTQSRRGIGTSIRPWTRVDPPAAILLHPHHRAVRRARHSGGCQAGLLMFRHGLLKSSTDRLAVRQRKTEMSWRRSGTDILASPDLRAFDQGPAIHDVELQDQLHLHANKAVFNRSTMPAPSAFPSRLCRTNPLERVNNDVKRTAPMSSGSSQTRAPSCT